jgi:recombination DNA repair RAD52 pathway protein
MNRNILEAPFAAEQIKQRQGNFGQTLAYIEAHAVIQRLNDAFASAWSFEILEHHILKDINEVIVLGRLTAGGISKCQFGASAITRAKQSTEIISLADDLKSAATDSLKKCATMLGVGLSLYGARPLAQKSPCEQTHPSVTPFRREQEHQDNHNGNDNGNGRISAKQHQYAVSLAQQNRGMTKKELDDHCVGIYGAGVDFISRKDASALINALRSEQVSVSQAKIATK